MKRKMEATQSSDLDAQNHPNTAFLQATHFPLDILRKILLNVPPHQVVRGCRLVCHEADDGFNGWTIVENGGDHWKIEAPMVSHPEEEVQKNFVTSYRMCLKSQLINLRKEGYNFSFMDEIQPHIRISDWYAPRYDCGSEYLIIVELLNNRRKVLQKFAPETVTFPQWNDQPWNQMTHVFKDYGPGVRYIRFTHGGKDTQFWAGWYGVRVTDSCVELCPADD
ncbi:hypothetical protein OJAV_G00068600 [Oryzias javanicus]|uniref:FBA domain-containing protein n=1 Tax=Oryzias javanicus TaxID=123683 RepID=A0A3S2UH95_ORYJA|nr:hypothetical protein OJAV_G00068600 [Oryzias javanicus]